MENASLSNLPGTSGMTNQAPVKNQHPDYDKYLKRWTRMRDVCEGQDAVHEKGTDYLPRLKDQPDEDYDAYKCRATFYNATWRTLAALVGMLFRRAPQVTAPDAVKELFEDVTMSGMPMDTFALQVATEALGIGRMGLLVDYPQAQPGITQADALTLNMRPMMAMYESQQIINWAERTINNKTVLSKVVLKVKHVLTIEDGFDGSEFEEKTEDRYRVLDLDDAGLYRVRVYRIDSQGNQQQVGADVYPVMAGAPMPFIPFLIISVDSLRPKVTAPPLIDLADVNLAHYRVTADYEHGCHMTALPTPVVTGYQPITNDEKLYIGSTAAWVFPQPDTRAFMLEFSGAGLATLERNLQNKEQQMAILGARMLAADKRAVESGEAAAIHRAGENSVMAAGSGILTQAFTQAVQWMADWIGAPGEVLYKLNDKFVPGSIDPQMLTALVAAYQAGVISMDTLFARLRDAEVHDPESVMDDELAKIAANPPALLAGAPGDEDDGDVAP